MVGHNIDSYLHVWIEGFQTRFLIYWLTAALLALLVRWLVGQWASLRIQDRWPPARAYLVEALYSLRTIATKAMLGVLVFALGVSGVITLNHTPGPWPLMAVQLLFIIMMQDTYVYWIHRLLHTRWFFKYVHRLHHETITPTPFTTLSMTVAEALMINIFYVIMLVIFPVYFGLYVIAYACAIAISLLQHCGAEFFPPWMLRHRIFAFLNSATHHDYHHSGNYNTNYGFYFAFWDRALKTTAPHLLPEKAAKP